MLKPDNNFILSEHSKPKFRNYGGNTKLCFVKGSCAAGDLMHEYPDYFANYPENPGDKPMGKALGCTNSDGYAFIIPYQN